ncbi:MAG: KEOPS complex subunit Pcc1 [Haloferacaceae archaeon]
MDRPHDAVLRFSEPDERRARLVADAVAVETTGVAAVDDRSRTGVAQTDETVVVRVEAADLVALRAACATWTRLVGVAERVAGGM